MNKLLAAALLAFPLLAFSMLTRAQYPAKPVRAVVAFGTGGATDVIARIIAASMSQSLGQPVVIDNKPGADGMVAGAEVAKSAPDGYTVFFATSTQVSALPSLRKNVPFDPLEFTPIGGIGNFSFFWAVHPSLPVKSLKELADYGRANPGKLNAGSRIELMLITGTLAQHVRDGRARGLATLLDKRSKTLPDLPTMSEAGMAPFPAVPWMGFLGPDRIEAQAMDLNPLTAEAIGTLAREQTEVWRRLTSEAGIVAE